MTEQSKQVEFNLFAVIQRVVRGRYILLATTLLGIALALIAIVLTRPWYSSQSQFLPPQSMDLSSGSTTAALLSGGADSGDLYLGLLASRTVQDDVVDHLGLKSIYHATNQTKARALLAANSKFSIGRNALVSIEVRADDPQLAARIANTYLDALYRLSSSMAASSSEARRLFYQQQLMKQRAELDQAEVSLKQIQEKTGIVIPTGEAQAGLTATAQLEAQIGAAEERLSGLVVGATDQNPQVIQARAQIAQLQAQLARQQQDSNAISAGIPSNRQLPGLTLEVEMKARDVKVAETAYDTLLGQYSKVRLLAIDPGPQLQVVDRAIPAESKAGPSRRGIVTYGFILGFFSGLFYVLFLEPLQRILRRFNDHPATQPR
jgi:tyrosine-protein kinase Etk/Wzc